MSEKLEALLSNLPAWIAGLAASIVALYGALRAPRKTKADVDTAESSADIARVNVFGQSFTTLKELLDYFEKRFEAVSADAERLRAENQDLFRKLRQLEQEAENLRREASDLRAELARLKGLGAVPA